MKTLRPYQLDAITTLRERILNGHRQLVLHARCGAGKTVMAIHLMGNAVDKGKRCLFVVHRRGLVDNCVQKLAEDGLNCSVLMAGRRQSVLDDQITVASRDTLTARSLRGGSPLPDADLVVIDEGHLATGAQYRKLIGHYGKTAIVLLLTATPAGPNGSGLGDVATCIVSAATSEQLIQDGFIVPTRAFGPNRIDLEGVKTVAGDYHKEQLTRRMDNQKLIGDIVEHWLEIANGRPTVAFACRRDHARHIQAMFTENGVRAAYIDGETPDEEREEVRQAMEEGDIKIVCNVDVISIGVDWPFLSCCIDARPTKSMVRALQAWGRISRPYGDKTDAILLDHADNCLRLGIHPDDDFQWPLSKSEKVRKGLKKDPKEREIKVCDSCYAMYYGGKCPNCGAAKSKQFKVEKGRLVEITKQLEKKEPTHEDRERAWRGFVRVAFHKGWPLSRASSMFLSKFGRYPHEGEFAEYWNGEKWPQRMWGTDKWTALRTPVRNIWPDMGKRRKSPPLIFSNS